MTTRVAVRSEALREAARVIERSGRAVGDAAENVVNAVFASRPPGLWPTAPSGLADRLGAFVAWIALERDLSEQAGPTGLWGESLELSVLAGLVDSAASAYEEVEIWADRLLWAVGAGVSRAPVVGWFDDGAEVSTQVVGSSTQASPLSGLDGLVAAGEGLPESAVRVIEVESAEGGSSWVVVIPGTQRWSPVAGANPFDLTTDGRAVTGSTVAVASGVAAALTQAQRGRVDAGDDPVLLVGHSQGGILAAGLAANDSFRRRHRVTHVLTSGAPVGVFALPSSVRVLSLERADDPVPRLDLTPNPASPTWTTLRVGDEGGLDVSSHDRRRYVETAAELGSPLAGDPGALAWQESAYRFLDRPVRSITDVAIERPQ